MSDIVERLHNSLLKGDDPKFYMLRNADIAEAAAEIERLKAALRLTCTVPLPDRIYQAVAAVLEGKT